MNRSAGTTGPSLTLASGTKLLGHYRIDDVLGRGGFGITYLASDLNLNTRVAIKEFLPRTLAGRDTDRTTVLPHTDKDKTLFEYGLTRFMEEAQLVESIDHPHVVRVRTAFRANGTAYLVMDYYEGESLGEYHERLGGKLEPAEAVAIMRQVLDGLAAAHAKQIYHRDVKPDNIYLRDRGDAGYTALLLDFGAARQAVENQSHEWTAVLSAGYAPLEQYSRSGNQGPWTDTYGCAAVLYHLITGVIPQDATSRVTGQVLAPPRQLNPDCPEPIERAILRGLAMDTSERPQSAREFAQLLEQARDTAAAPPTVVAPDPGAAPTEVVSESPPRQPEEAVERPEPEAAEADETRLAETPAGARAGTAPEPPDERETPVSAPPTASDLVRRLAAVCFVDIVGYSELSSDHETAALRLVRLLQRVTRSGADAFGGRVVKFIGDAALASFPSTDGAVRAALRMEREFREQSGELGHPTPVRIGLHVGEVVADEDGDIYGDGVNLASRLQEAAEPGRVLVSEDVWRQIRQRREFAFEPLGERELKGIAAPVAVYNVTLAERTRTRAVVETSVAAARRFAWQPTLALARRLAGGKPGIAAAAVLVAIAAFFSGRALLMDSSDGSPDAPDTPPGVESLEAASDDPGASDDPETTSDDPIATREPASDESEETAGGAGTDEADPTTPRQAGRGVAGDEPAGGPETADRDARGDPPEPTPARTVREPPPEQLAALKDALGVGVNALERTSYVTADTVVGNALELADALLAEFPFSDTLAALRASLDTLRTENRDTCVAIAEMTDDTCPIGGS